MSIGALPIIQEHHFPPISWKSLRFQFMPLVRVVKNFELRTGLIWGNFSGGSWGSFEVDWRIGEVQEIVNDLK